MTRSKLLDLHPASVARALCLAWGTTSSIVVLAAVPQPAIDACTGKSSSASCSFQTPTGTVSGTCQTAESQFACVPASATSGTTPGGTTGGTTTGGGTPSGGTTGGTTGNATVAGTTIGNTGGNLPDTGQTGCYDTSGAAMSCPAAGVSTYGQDAQYAGNAPAYTDNGNGTITDKITGLMWQQDPDRNGDGKIDSQDMMSFAEAVAGAAGYRQAGYTDWRLPTIKELYSLIHFGGSTGTASPSSTTVPSDAVPYIDTNYFKFAYGDTAAGLRYIDAQYWSATEYVGKTMAGVTSATGDATAFGVNFADGRIKGYGSAYRVINDKRFVRYVRAGNGYGANQFASNGDGTISDGATGLMWLQNDSGYFKPGTRSDGSLDWAGALAWCEGLSHAGHDDWRLPNAKELQSLVDYTRSPATSSSAAIDPLFNIASIVDEGGKTNYPFHWTSTTHRDGPNFAVYIAFGEALGCMNGVVTDVHGAGAQRSDPKTASGTSLGCGNGPQGDVIRVYNHARCVRTGTASAVVATGASYDATTQLLALPVLDVGGGSRYKVGLKLVSAAEWLFEVAELVQLSGTATASASYNAGTGLLTAAAVSYGGRNYAVKLQLVSSSPIRFRMVAAD